MKKKQAPPKGGGKGTRERPQGGSAKRASGVNKPVTKESVPNVVADNTYGKPSQRQRM